MKRPSRSILPLCMILGAVLAGISLPSARAQTAVAWTSTTAGTYDWSNAGNWTGGNIPNNLTESAQFGGLEGNVTVNQDIDNLEIFGLGTGLVASTGTFTLTGKAITLNNSGSLAASTLTAAGNNPVPLFEVDLNVIDNNGLTITAQNNIRINGNLTLVSTTGTMALTGGGFAYLGGNNSINGYMQGSNAALFIATGTGAFGGTGTYKFGTFANATGGVVARAVGRTDFTLAVDSGTFSGAGNTASRNIFSSGGVGTNLNITTSTFLNDAVGDSAFLITRSTPNQPFSPNPTGVGAVTFSGSTFTISRNVLLEGSAATGFADTKLIFAPASGTQTWSGSIGIITANSQMYAHSGSNTGGPIVVKEGAGTVILSGTNNYVFQTGVAAGTLLVNGLHAAAGTTINATVNALGAGRNGFGDQNTGNYVVNDGATLGGTGRIFITGTAANSNMVHVQSGGFLAPGASIGTFTLDGGNMSGAGTKVLSMATGAEFVFELDGSGGASDQLAFWNYVEGDLLLNNNKINLSLLGTEENGTYTVELFRFFSDSGITETASGIGSGLALGTLGANIGSANIIYGVDAISLQYTVVPEPSTGALVALVLGSAALGRRRRRLRKM